MSKKVRGNLLFVSHDGDFKGGAEISGLELLKSAQKRGYSVTAVVPNESEFYRQLVTAGISANALDYGWHVPSSTSVNQYSDFDNIGSATSIAKLIKDKKIDCVVSNSTVVPWGAFAAAITNTPHIWVCREFPENDLAYIADYYDFVGSFSNTILANSKNVASYIKDRFSIEHVGHFYSFVDTSRLTLSSLKGEPRLIQVGNISSRKNQLDLVEAAGILKKNGTDFKILFIGHVVEKEYYDRLKNRIEELSLENTISFEPFTSNPWELIKSNDIFVQTSSSESIGRTTTEAMKLGLVCVGSDIPGVSEAFELGGGQLYKHRDAKDLAIKLTDILANPSAYNKLAKNAQKQALINMSEESCHSPFFTELEKTLGTPNPHPELRHLYPYFLANLHYKIELTKQLNHEQDTSSKLMHERAMLYKKLDAIYDSKSWKITQKLKAFIKK